MAAHRGKLACWSGRGMRWMPASIRLRKNGPSKRWRKDCARWTAMARRFYPTAGRKYSRRALRELPQRDAVERGEANQLGDRAYAELAVDLVAVRLDRLRADEERLGDSAS